MPLLRMRPVPLILILLLLPALGSAATWQGRSETVDGVEQVHNPSQPFGGTQELEPRQLWHLGADEDAPDEELFGFITEILTDEQGNSYFLDAQLNQIHVFGADGDFLRVIGRNGEGPGEFSNARQIFFLPENRLGVAQMMPSRIAVMDREGNGFSDLPLPGEPSMMRMVENVRSAGDRCVISIMTPLMTAEQMALHKTLQAVDPDGEILATYRKIEEKMEGGAMRITLGGGDGDDFSGNWNIDDAGRVYTAPLRDQYLIRVYDSKGPLARVIHRDYESRKRTRDEIAEIKEGFGDIPEGMPSPEINAYDRDIDSFLTRPGGELWVFSSRNQAAAEAGQLGPFDVFDAQGHFVKQLTLKVDFDPERDTFNLNGDRLYIVKEALGASATFQGGGAGMNMEIRMGASEDEEEEGEGAPLSVICYELPSNG